MKNIHITLTEFRNESRVLKEISSLQSSDIFNSFTVIALAADDLNEYEMLTEFFSVHRLKLRTRACPKNAIFQLLKFFEFMIKCYKLVRNQKADVVNLHTLALLPLGWILKTTLNVKIVYDAHELETEKNGLTGFRKKISKWVERNFIKTCDLVIVVGDNISRWYAENYSISPPLVVKNAPMLRTLIRRNHFREILGITHNQKIFLYQGALSKGRGIQLILDTFKSRADNLAVVVFMGYGDLQDDIQAAAMVYPNIYYFSAVNPGVVLEYTSSADIGISIIENTCLSYYYCMPNKLYEYAMVGLPVIVSDMKEMADAVKSYDFGSVLKDLSVESLNATIDFISSQDLADISENAYSFASSNSWEHQESIMIEAYQRMLNI